MKIKRVALLSLALFMVAGTAAYAGSRWGTYEGYSKVQVKINDNTMSTGNAPAFVIKGSTMLPLRETAESLNAIVKWDGANQTADIYKPNVNIMVAQDLGFNRKGILDSISKPFFKVALGSSNAFSVFVQVDSLDTSVDGFKISIIDPNDSVVAEDTHSESTPVTQDYLWYTSPFNVKFSESGSYTVRFSFKVNGDFVTVGEKTIVSE